LVKASNEVRELKRDHTHTHTQYGDVKDLISFSNSGKWTNILLAILHLADIPFPYLKLLTCKKSFVRHLECMFVI